MFFFERFVGGRKYRVAAESVWDPRTKQPVSRQGVHDTRMRHGDEQRYGKVVLRL